MDLSWPLWGQKRPRSIFDRQSARFSNKKVMKIDRSEKNRILKFLTWHRHMQQQVRWDYNFLIFRNRFELFEHVIKWFLDHVMNCCEIAIT